MMQSQTKYMTNRKTLHFQTDNHTATADPKRSSLLLFCSYNTEKHRYYRTLQCSQHMSANQ